MESASFLHALSHVLVDPRKFRSRNPEPNHEPQPTEVDTTYQELDLTKMNIEDNYESLKVNAASNDGKSTYTGVEQNQRCGGQLLPISFINLNHGP